MRPSIKRQLLLSQGVMLAFIFCLLIGVTYWRTQNEITSIFRTHLRQIALVLQRNENDKQQFIIIGRTTLDKKQLLTQIWDNQASATDTTLPATMPVSPKAGLKRLYFKDDIWLVYRLDDQKTGKIIQVAMRDAALKEITLEGMYEAIPPLVIALILLSAVGWGLINRALKPLNDLRKGVTDKHYTNLSALPVADCPVEIMPLVEQLNLLLARLQEAIAYDKQFIADAAHQLRTPLAALSLQLEVLKSADSETERVSALAELETGVARNIQLSRQLLALARAESSSPLAYRAVDLMPILGAVHNDLAFLARQKHFSIAIEPVSEAATIVGNPDDFYALFYNLMHNAIHYSVTSGTLNISINQAAGDIKILFADDGLGIPAHLTDKVFERFFRVGDDKHGEGSGLGLSIVKHIVDTYRGDIAVTTGLHNTGVGFKITLPQDKDMPTL